MSLKPSLGFNPQTLETSSPQAKSILEEAQKRIGHIPNIYTMMANSPQLLDTYTHGDRNYRQYAELNAQEKEIVYLTISKENNCHYCTAVHSTLSDTMSRVPTEITDAILDNKEIPDNKLSALNKFTRIMVVSRGQPSPDELLTFISSGYNRQHVLDIILAISVKTLSNYSNHFFDTPIDDVFSSRFEPAEQV